MNMMKKMIAGLLTVSLMGAVAFTSCGTGSTDKPAESANSDTSAITDGVDSDAEELRVGMECGYAPFNWTQMDDSNGAVAIEGGKEFAGGYDVEIAKAVAESLGKKLVIVKTDWDGLIPALTSGKIDAVIAGMSPTAERKETIDFTDEYYVSDLVIVVKKDGDYATAKALADFSGAKITGQISTTHYTMIEQIEGVEQATAMESFPAMVMALSAGTVDGYVSERPGALSAIASNPNLTFIEFEAGKGFEYDITESAIAIGLVKDSPLKDELNAAIAKITEEDRAAFMNAAITNQPSAE